MASVYTTRLYRGLPAIPRSDLLIRWEHPNDFGLAKTAAKG
ncbi:MAG: hypothetical protein ACI82A_004494 [Candidatus Azotimanducaceae bacterium]|jgi:hypothetical protein